MEIAAEARRLADLLEVAPGRIAAVTAGVPDESLSRRSVAEPWSANDVLAHLRACQDVRGKLVNEMLTRNHPVVRYVSPRTYIRKDELPRPSVPAIANHVRRTRARFVQLLRSLRAGQWMRGAGPQGSRTETVLDCA
ncbi:MAG: DinB family protein [Dehalococcoidia bacterium]|uniref:DinB family protein n=1 Tax=Candidatus Amarobacter glycogenicus TaxID=3140699 RepID=UPI003136E983|nr:DinB family protein [Dehalococcoidia bacterium]